MLKISKFCQCEMAIASIETKASLAQASFSIFKRLNRITTQTHIQEKKHPFHNVDKENHCEMTLVNEAHSVFTSVPLASSVIFLLVIHVSRVFFSLMSVCLCVRDSVFLPHYSEYAVNKWNTLFRFCY